ncbi:MAG: CHAT domain-containing protein, partial [Candidatus Binatia bacterium]
ISSPTDYPPLDVEQEWAKLQESVADLTKSGLIVLERLDNATLSLLQRRLRREEYHVFHFIGHGGFEQKLQDGVLIFEDDAERGRSVSGQDLGTLLHDHRTLRLAILNACEGARTSRTDPFAGTAQSLVQQGLPAVIAMQFEITDEAAITFAHEFYAAVADGYPVDASVAEARKAIFAEGNGLEWGTPVLYLRAADGLIFHVERPAEPARIIEQRGNLTKPAEEKIISNEPVPRRDLPEKPLHSTEMPPKGKGGLPTWSMMGTGAVLLLVIAVGIQWILDGFGREMQKPISIVSLTVAPEKKDIKLKDRVALQVKAVYSDGNAKHITEGVEWKSSNAAVASVNSTGELEAKKEGTTKITARYGAMESSPLELSFLAEEVPPSSPPEVVSLAVDASRQELKTDERLTLKARALYSDGGEKFVTQGVAWQSSQPNVAVVSSTGQVVGRSAGRSEITARYEGILSSPLNLAVKSAEGGKPALPAVRLVSLTVESKAQEIKLYERLRLGVRAKYSDGTEKLIAGGIEWRSNQPGVLDVSADGQAEGRSEGRAEVTANYGGISSYPLVLVVKGTVKKQGPDVPLKNKMITEHLLSARAYRDRGDYAEALTVLEKARASDPENREVEAAIEATRRACNAERRLGRGELKC